VVSTRRILVRHVENCWECPLRQWGSCREVADPAGQGRRRLPYDENHDLAAGVPDWCPLPADHEQPADDADLEDLYEDE
jgi:hypothetical protein